MAAVKPKGGRPEILDSFKVKCPTCGTPVTLNVIEHPRKYATLRCPGCRTEVSYPSRETIPPPIYGPHAPLVVATPDKPQEIPPSKLEAQEKPQERERESQTLEEFPWHRYQRRSTNA